MLTKQREKRNSISEKGTLYREMKRVEYTKKDERTGRLLFKMKAEKLGQNRVGKIKLNNIINAE